MIAIDQIETIKVPAATVDEASTRRMLASFPELAYDWQLAHILSDMLQVEPIDLIQATMQRFGVAS